MKATINFLRLNNIIQDKPIFNKMRFVKDMRMVNSQYLPDGYQIPLIGHVTDKIAGNEWYCTFDCSQSFHQIRYDSGEQVLDTGTESRKTIYIRFYRVETYHTRVIIQLYIH